MLNAAEDLILIGGAVYVVDKLTGKKKLVRKVAKRKPVKRKTTRKTTKRKAKK